MPKSFAVLPPENRYSPFSWHRRFEPVIVLSYRENLSAPEFIKVTRELFPEADSKLSGFTDQFQWGESQAVGIAGRRGMLVFESDRLLRDFGGTLEVTAGFHPRTKPESVSLIVFCNELRLGQLSFDENQQRHDNAKLTLPPGFLTLGKNVLTFVVERRDNLAIGPRESLLAIRPVQASINW